MSKTSEYIRLAESCIAVQWGNEDSLEKLDGIVLEYTLEEGEQEDIFCQECGRKYLTHALPIDTTKELEYDEMPSTLEGIYGVICPTNWVVMFNEKKRDVYTDKAFQKQFRKVRE